MAVTGTPAADVALVGAAEANFVDIWARLGDAAGEVHSEAGMRWIAAGDHPMLNAVIDTPTNPLPVPLEIEKLAALIVERAGSCLWWLLPSAGPTRLEQHLRGSGFSPASGSWPGMAVELDLLRPAAAVPGYDLSRVDGSAAFDEYLTVFDASLSPGPAFTEAMRRAGAAIGFTGDAPFAHFVVRENGAAVACASMMEGGGAAGLYNVGTLEGARRRGLGAWVSSVALEHGRGRGHVLGVLQASDLGRGVYERLGFREVCRLAPYIRSGPGQQEGAQTHERGRGAAA